MSSHPGCLPRQTAPSGRLSNPKGPPLETLLVSPHTRTVPQLAQVPLGCAGQQHSHCLCSRSASHPRPAPSPSAGLRERPVLRSDRPAGFDGAGTIHRQPGSPGQARRPPALPPSRTDGQEHGKEGLATQDNWQQTLSQHFESTARWKGKWPLPCTTPPPPFTPTPSTPQPRSKARRITLPPRARGRA